MLTLIFFFSHVLLVYPFRIKFYYFIWLKNWLPRLQNQEKSFKKGIRKNIISKIIGKIPLNTLRITQSILESKDADTEDSSKAWVRKTGVPVFIRREDLMAKSFWPDWAFAEVILFNQVRLLQRELGASKYCELHVDLQDQSYGIYNNAGKRFLRDEWGNCNDFKDECFKRSQLIHDFINTSNNDELILDCDQMPIRWASGGFLPIIKWKNEKWVALFFRDLNPIGWNVANGASESKEEYKDIDLLATREFGEELLVLNCKPRKNCLYFAYDFPDAERNTIAEKFMKEHLKLRRSHDKLYIEKSKNKIPVDFLNTPFRIHVKYHSPTFKTLHYELRNILFQLNPCEFGVEVLRVCELEMPTNGGYLLDGEIWTKNNMPILVRRPIILFKLDFLKKVYQSNNNSLGNHLSDDSHIDCKRLLKSIDSSNFQIFDADLEYRENRIHSLKSNVHSQNNFELERLESWQEKYFGQFKKIKNNGFIDPNEHPDLVTFCPVTWKALEQVFRYKII